MLRVTDLGKQDGRAHLRKTVAETKNKSTSHISLPVLGESRHKGAGDHDDAPNSDGNLATPILGGVGSVKRSVMCGIKEVFEGVIHDEEADNGADIVRIIHDSQAIIVRFIKVFVPSIHLLRRVHHHPGRHQQTNQELLCHQYSPIVTRRRRSDAENRRPKVQFAQVGIFSPVDFLELRCLFTSRDSIAVGRFGAESEVRHIDLHLTNSSMEDVCD